jgi:protocatechuate 3,4-dioxygenase beta subunit
MTKIAGQAAPPDTFSAYADEDVGSPPSLFPDYRSTTLRSPLQARLRIPQTLTEVTGPAACWKRLMGNAVADMTRQHAGTPLGQRIIVQGHVLDEDRRRVPRTVIEIWQANAAGRYIHSRDNWDAPLDPNFTGADASRDPDVFSGRSLD